MPLWSDKPISQVRLVEKPSWQLSGNESFKVRSAEAFSSGVENPLSPAKPQQVIWSGMITSWAQALARLTKLSASPMRELQLLEHKLVDKFYRLEDL